ncbi:MAG: caspase family protein [Rhodospirillales bacterium]
MRQRALLIGVDDCAFAPLSSCVNDALAMRDALVSLGVVAAADCTLMTSPHGGDSAARPTREAILDWLLPLHDAADPLDRLIVYFAGHGLSVRLGREADALRTVLVPAGVDALKNAGGRMIDLDELVGRFARRGARAQHWIVDACRNLPPDGVLPSVATIGWDVPAPGDPRDAVDMAQAVLFAVAPLGQAAAQKGGHGVLTGHLLDGLACTGEAQWGAAGWYDEGRDTWLVSLESLCEYAARRIGAELPADSWQRDYLLPRLWRGERDVGPLRDAGALPDRPFGLYVEPAEAADAVSAALSVKRNRIAAWPPHAHGVPVPLPPERYRLTAALAQGAAGWLPPQVAQPVVDLRETDRVVIRVAAVPPPPPSPAPAPPAQTLDDLLSAPFGVGDAAGPSQPPAATGAPPLPDVLADAPAIAPAELTEAFVGPTFVPHTDLARRRPPGVRYADTPDDGHYEMPPPTLTVRAIDPGARVRLTRLSGGRDRREAAVNARVALSEGLWRVEVMIGDEVIAMREEDLAAGNDYTVTATAQITPALAALLPEPQAAAAVAASSPPGDLVPSETIGPMQGAILPTLLPMLAVKPFDTQEAILHSFAPRLAIPSVALDTDAPAALAVAFDGAWDELPAHADGMAVAADAPVLRMWRDPSARVTLFACPQPRGGDTLEIVVPGWGRLDVAAPRLPGYCATVAATLWRDGRWDLSVSQFMLPPGADNMVRPGRLARALAIAARLYRAQASLDDVDYDVFSLVSYGSWGDPVLGALAWFGRHRRFADAAALDPARRADLAMRQDGVRNFLAHRAPALADTRVIAALGGPPDQRETALDALLDDPGLGRPVLAEAVATLARHALARGRLDHWSVVRFQQLAPDAVFNAVRFPP